MSFCFLSDLLTFFLFSFFLWRFVQLSRSSTLSTPFTATDSSPLFVLTAMLSSLPTGPLLKANPLPCIFRRMPSSKKFLFFWSCPVDSVIHHCYSSTGRSLEPSLTPLCSPPMALLALNPSVLTTSTSPSPSTGSWLTTLAPPFTSNLMA